MKYLIGLLFLLPTTALAGEQVFYGPNGAIAGRATTDKGYTVFYDKNGSVSGRSVTTGGYTVFYDRDGRVTGRATRK